MVWSWVIVEEAAGVRAQYIPSKKNLIQLEHLQGQVYERWISSIPVCGYPDQRTLQTDMMMRMFHHTKGRLVATASKVKFVVDRITQ
jgi:hypothetical protein